MRCLRPRHRLFVRRGGEAVTWTVQSNDLVGGYIVTDYPHPLSEHDTRESGDPERRGRILCECNDRNTAEWLAKLVNGIVKDDLYSHVSVHDSSLPDADRFRRLTWRELWERTDEQRRAAEAFAQLLSHLDRCEHGRHEGDACAGQSGCNGPSHGNPLLGCPALPRYQELVISNRQIGYTMYGDAIVVPKRAEMMHPEAWVKRRG